MPNEVKYNEYKVFISCPGDIQTFQQALEARINGDVNLVYKKQNVQIKPLTWKKNTFSEMGKNPQAVINDQIGDYDIYIGLMGNRFGSPTDQFGSGTEEEYNLALNRYKNDPDNIRVSFFFKLGTISNSMSDTEFEQLKKVRYFKASVQKDGLFKEIETQDEFVNSAIDSITDFINKKEKPKQNGLVPQIQHSMFSEVPNQTVFRIESTFMLNFLDHLDAQFKTNAAEINSLSEIYIDLDARMLSQQVDKENHFATEENLSTKSFFKEVSDPIKYIITGNQKSGRTALCKQLYKHYHKLGCVPIFLNGQDIKNADTSNFEKLVHRSFSDQYSEAALIRFSELPKDKIVIIIDDIHASILNIKTTIHLIATLDKNYRNIVLSSDDLFLIDSYLDGNTAFENLQHFQKYELKDVGYKLRCELIEKWYQVGRKETISKEELALKVTNASRAIDDILGKNFVPKKPFVILVLLQAIEAGSTTSLANSSFVRYYKYLIDTALLRNIKPDQSELYYVFLPELAYQFYLQGLKSISTQQLEELINEFSARKGISKDILKEVNQNLIKSKLLEVTGNKIKFLHDYCYYYFLGQYLSKHINENRIKDHIKTLCEKLFVEENANIIVFLSYHTDSPVIIDHILPICTSLFQTEAAFDFDEKKNSPVNQLIQECPKIVYDHSKAEEVKNSQIATKDRIEATEENRRQEAKKEKDCFEDLAFSEKLYLAFKTIHILGQLLKNHYALLDAAPKKEISLAAMELGLRCLNFIYDKLSNDLDILTEIIKELDPKAGKKELPKLENSRKPKKKKTLAEQARLDAEREEKLREIKTQEAKKILFEFANFITSSFIKTTAHYLGAENLALTYDEIFKNDKRKSIAMVVMAIKLDFFKDFPIEELEKYIPDIENNKLAFHSMRRLIRYRMYMRPIDDFRLRQRIGNLANIEIANQILIEQKNERKTA